MQTLLSKSKNKNSFYIKHFTLLMLTFYLEWWAGGGIVRFSHTVGVWTYVTLTSGGFDLGGFVQWRFCPSTHYTIHMRGGGGGLDVGLLYIMGP